MEIYRITPTGYIMMSQIEEFVNGKYGWTIILAIIMIFTAISIFFYYRKDVYEPEPKSRILAAFLLGIVSVVPAGIISLAAILFFGLNPFIASIIVAPVVEEFAKGYMVIHLSKDDSFDGPLDGLIYGAMVGAGFAAVENLLYGLNALIATDITLGVGITTIRSLTQIIGHPLYTGLMGAGVGAYKVGISQNQFSNIWKSILLHGGWNLSVSLNQIGIILVGVAIVIALSIGQLRNELKIAVELDRQAFDRGYYIQKEKYLEEKKRRMKEGWWTIPDGNQNFTRNQPPERPFD